MITTPLQQRINRWEQVQDLKKRGKSIYYISTMLNIPYSTTRLDFHRETPPKPNQYDSEYPKKTENKNVLCPNYSECLDRIAKTCLIRFGCQGCYWENIQQPLLIDIQDPGYDPTAPFSISREAFLMANRGCV